MSWVQISTKRPAILTDSLIRFHHSTIAFFHIPSNPLFTVHPINDYYTILESKAALNNPIINSRIVNFGTRHRGDRSAFHASVREITPDTCSLNQHLH
jgi:hypothetical protein